jgi:hypothetical protein
VRLINDNANSLFSHRLGLQFENLDEFTSPNKMSGAVVNAFMNMLQANADELVDGSLFLDSDFFSGINKCLNCRTQERHCDILEQGGAHCIHCRRDGVICERPRLERPLPIAYLKFLTLPKAKFKSRCRQSL